MILLLAQQVLPAARAEQQSVLQSVPVSKSSELKNSQGYCRYATIHGSQIVFCSEDDLWTVADTGGNARRLTAGKGVASLPHFSPDGKLIAFVSTEEGAPEVYVIPAEGGEAKRITHMGASSLCVSGWSPDGTEILFCCNGRSNFAEDSFVFAVSPLGGRVRPLNLGGARTVSMSPTGAVVLGRNCVDPARWKRYRGGSAGEIWAADSLNSKFRQILKLNGNLAWPMWIGNRVYFLSDHEGVGNIYSANNDGTDLRRHTNEIQYYARFPSTDGQRIVYTAGARIHLLDTRTNSNTILNVTAASNITQAKRKFVAADDYLEEFDIHPEGHSVGIISRGQLFTMPMFEGAVIHHGRGSRVRYEQFHWLPDGKRFLVVTDENGYHQLKIHKLDETSSPEIITDEDLGRITELVVSPAKNRLAFTNHKHDLYILDYAKKKLKKIDHSPARAVSDLAWSPEGRWLAYTYAQNTSASIIRIANAETGEVHDVTRPVRYDFSPEFDPQGKYLYFLSTRDFYPVPDETQFNWSFPVATRPYLVTLRSDLQSPLTSKVRAFIKKDSDSDKEEDLKKDAELKIDFDNINGRILALPVDQADYRELLACSKGRVIYTRYPLRPLSPLCDADSQIETGNILAFDLEDQREIVLQRDVQSMVLGSDHQTLLYKSRGRLRAIDASKKSENETKSYEAGRENGWIDLSRVQVMVEPTEEWRQMFREAWRLQKENFWAEDMSQVDWNLIRNRYEALLPLVRTRGELSDLIWEMQGELGTSHAYEYSGDYQPCRNYARGFLGADLSYDQSLKGYRIEKIYRGDSWEPTTDSPLAEPGLNIHEGDIITAIGGQSFSDELSIDELLDNHAGETVQLTIMPPSAFKIELPLKKTSEKDDVVDRKARQVVVKTLNSESELRYRSWVENNRRLVHEKSNGQLGYVHIPDMGVQGFSEFHRGFLEEHRYPGLIIDVRYNRGGNVSSLLIEKLLRKRIGYDVSRWGMPESYPKESIGGPLVALTNQFAGSDGDIFSHAFKQYKMGPLVGKRSWGGVVGISVHRTLVDGTVTTQPEYAYWFSDVGWNVENHGVDPDYEVDIAPDEYKKEIDPQLSKAIELGLASLKERPVVLPEFGKHPSRAIPQALPPAAD